MKSAASVTKGLQLKKHLDATLGSGNLREAVRLPLGEDLNEWLAVNTVDFFIKYEYRWAEGITIKKPMEVSAPKYVEYLMDWIEAQLDDKSIFPQKSGTTFPHLLRRSKNYTKEVVPGVCTHLSLPLPDNSESQRRSTSQYLLQALCSVYLGIQTN